MIETILNKLGLSDVETFNAEAHSRRRHVRLPGLQTEVVVADRVYSVNDWSVGGLCFQTPPDSRMVVGDRVQLTMRFRLPHETVTISEPGKVVRTARQGGVAAQFAELSPENRRRFQRVIDGFQAQSFLESQLA